MGWTASLDMGSEKMVMALASGEGSVCHLKGIKIMASQGIEHGVIKDKEKVRMCIRSLMSELMKDREIEVMNVALSGAVLRIVERRIVVPIQKKVVEQSDLFRAEQRCIDAYGGGQDEVVDILLDFARDEEHSILISSHIVSDLEKLCDTIAFLHKGRLLLCEEKDTLREEYALWHGTAAQLAALDTRVYGKRVTPYGIEALVRRDAMPAGAELDPVSIEELFVLMVKGECAA